MATVTTPEALSISPSTINTRNQIFEAFRRWGYLQAQLDPLGQYLQPKAAPELEFDGPDADEARGYYCRTVAAEFMHIPDATRREWIQDRIEGRAGLGQPPDPKRTLELLLRAELFEQVIQSRYLGTK